MRVSGIFDWDTVCWEVGGQLAAFLGISSVIISIFEPMLTDLPFDWMLLVFGVGCFLFSWRALEFTVQRRAGR